MTRRTALLLSGVAALALLFVLASLDDRMRDAGGPGIIGFELAGSEDSSQEILADWGEKGQDAARLSTRLDFLFLIAYGVFLTLLVGATRDAGRRHGWARVVAVGGAIGVLPGLAAGFDALENVALLTALDGDGGSVAPLLGAIFAGAKFILLAIVASYLLAGLAQRVATRRRAA